MVLGIVNLEEKRGQVQAGQSNADALSNVLAAVESSMCNTCLCYNDPPDDEP